MRSLKINHLSRREFIKTLIAAGAGIALLRFLPYVEAAEHLAELPLAGPWLRKTIPVSGEKIPVIGMGTWRTFHVGDNKRLRDARTEVLRTFFDYGGGMIDSSPMYGSAEEVIGYGLEKLGPQKGLFSASKIWTISKEDGKEQFENSLRLWGLDRFDLFQVHNLLNFPGHLKTLRQEKKEGRVRYIGVTTSHGRRHHELETIMRTEDLDFVQLTYNILNREAEDKLLPLAAQQNIAVIANRPFQGGRLFDRFEHERLPEWAGEFDAVNWAQFFLKFIVSHPAVTCAIPATTKVAHMKENMGAAYGRLPDERTRQRMIEYVEALR